MDEFLQEFLIEGGELLDQLDHDFVELEKAPDSKELLARIFRAIHTLKGTGGAIGLKKVESINHHGENILARLREGKLSLSAEITSALLAMIDLTRQIFASLHRTGDEGELDCAPVVSPLVAILEAADGPGRGADKDRGSLTADTAIAATSQAVRPNKAHVADNPPPPLLGEVLLKQGAVEQDAIFQALASQQQGDPRLIGEILVHQGAVRESMVQKALETQAETREEGATSSSIRVDVHLLDKVMNLVGELVLARNQILQFTSSQADPAFLSTAQRLNPITTELQEGVMKTRMQPIGNVWNKFPRIVRDLANAAGKSVRLEMQGTQTELDKTIIEAIKDPLTHIVRNALDHGIEGPEERESKGKQRQALLLLRAFHEGGQVNIEISDDGAGINLDAIRAKVVERGIISAPQVAAMSEREIANLIFLPGFSTATKVTNISGRGVGMDVVKTNIEKIGGTVDLFSTRGRGTTLKIKIPLTLAIIPALIVTSGGERFAIPQVSLVELVRLEGNAAERGIERIQDAAVYRLRGNLLPIIDLNRELKLADMFARQAGDAINIVVLQADGRQFGLVVEEINDTEEIVVKPLGKQLKGLSCFAGATIMGDGTVALILDILGLAQRASLTAASRTRAAKGSGEEAAMHDAERESSAPADQIKASQGPQAWLLVRVGERGRFAVPLSVVSRLEEFDPQSLELSGSRPVVQYRGQIMPLVRVADALRLSPQIAGVGKKQEIEQRGPMQVVVHSAGGQSVGLVVDEILDIVDQRVTIDRRAQDPLLIGSAILQQHVTDLLNVPELMASAAGTGRTQ